MKILFVCISLTIIEEHCLSGEKSNFCNIWYSLNFFSCLTESYISIIIFSFSLERKEYPISSAIETKVTSSGLIPWYIISFFFVLFSIKTSWFVTIFNKNCSMISCCVRNGWFSPFTIGNLIWVFISLRHS